MNGRNGVRVRTRYTRDIGETFTTSSAPRGPGAWAKIREKPGPARQFGVWLAELKGMTSSEKIERRIHLDGRAQFEIVRADLERTLRRIYGSDWPKGFDEVIARIVRARVRDAYGLAPSR